jgi:hypothetical protein
MYFTVLFGIFQSCDGFQIRIWRIIQIYGETCVKLELGNSVNVEIVGLGHTSQNFENTDYPRKVFSSRIWKVARGLTMILNVKRF